MNIKFSGELLAPRILRPANEIELILVISRDNGMDNADLQGFCHLPGDGGL